MSDVNALSGKRRLLAQGCVGVAVSEDDIVLRLCDTRCEQRAWTRLDDDGEPLRIAPPRPVTRDWLAGEEGAPHHHRPAASISYNGGLRIPHGDRCYTHHHHRPIQQTTPVQASTPEDVLYPSTEREQGVKRPRR